MFEIDFEPKIYEIGLNEKIKFTSLIDYMQHAAYTHAHILGVGHHQIFKKNLTWLLLRYVVEIDRYPDLNDKLKVVTWVAESESPKFTLREFEIYDENNNIVCKASTSWLLFNYRKRQIMNFKEYWPDFQAEKRRAVDYDFPKLDLPAKIDANKKIKVRLHDLDINQHVNHRMHIEWLIEGMSQKIWKKYELERLEISYKEQAFLDEEIDIETEIHRDANQIKGIHQLVKGKKRKLVSKAITQWRKQ